MEVPLVYGIVVWLVYALVLAYLIYLTLITIHHCWIESKRISKIFILFT